MLKIEMTIVLTYLTGIIFIFYGYLVILSNHMRTDFERFGIAKFRLLTGALELLGGLGLIIGVHYNLLLIFSSAGLSLLMTMGVITRIRVKDSLIAILPAFTLMLINFYIFIDVL
jgi:hypothetical protein